LRPDDNGKKSVRPESVQGIGASPGVAIGRAFLLDRQKVKTPHYRLSELDVETEQLRFKTAVQLSDHQLVEVKEKLEKGGGNEHALIIEAHRMMLADPMIVDEVKRIIREERVNAEWAVRQSVGRIKEQFEKLSDEYFRERQADVDFIGDRLIRNLMGQIVDAVDLLAEVPANAILVAHDLSPSDAALLLSPQRCAGFVTDIGGHTSHTAIVARAREVPGVVGAAPASERIAHGDMVALDGSRGMVVINPTDEQVRLCHEAMRRRVESEQALLRLRDLPCTGTDGRRLELLGNIEFQDEVPNLLDHGAEGIGLFRTEFLYLGRATAPSEEEHYQAYRSVLEQMGDRPVTIRTVDLGGDKISVLDQVRREKEQNPALGLRALRFCLKYRDIFRVQLRAMLRASVHGRLRIMFPMVSGVQELREAKAFLSSVRVELGREGIAVAEEIPVGIMVETPSAAQTADRLARECDFFSVGTNDLIQYTVAIDRQNRDVAYLYHPLHLALLRSLKFVVDSAHEAKIPVGMCGEMASDPMHALVLSGLGFDNLSMSAGQLPVVKRILRSHTLHEAKELLEQCLSLDTTDEIERVVRSTMELRFGFVSSDGEAS
jgi:phosphotransferase system enzyme I (PtsI)